MSARRAPHATCPIPIRFTLLTSMFLHGSWMHLLGNMLYLWIVGDNVEEVLGSFGYLIVYLRAVWSAPGPDPGESRFGHAHAWRLGRDRRHHGGLRDLVPA